MSFRGLPEYKLRDNEIQDLKREFKELGGPEHILRFNTFGLIINHTENGIKKKSKIIRTQLINGNIHVLGDVLPYNGPGSFRYTLAIGTMTSKCVLAHELAHYRFRGTSLKANSWEDEIRASYYAASCFNLTPEEKSDLIEFANWTSKYDFNQELKDNIFIRRYYNPKREANRKSNILG